MPSQLPVPSISDHLRIGKRAIVGQRDLLADDRSGSIYDLIMGTAAMAWSREAFADQDKFRSIYFNTARSQDLTDYVLQRFGIARIQDTKGMGTGFFSRPTSAAGAGTIYQGTQFIVSSPSGGATVYEVAADAACGATQLVVPITVIATTFGLGVAVSNAGGVVTDPLWDNTFTVAAVNVTNGTVFEPAEVFRARVISTLLAQRPGYPTLIISTLQGAGATQILLFPSNYQGATGQPISACYVGDQGFNCSGQLLAACRVAVDTARVLGPDLYVYPMASTALTVQLAVSLWKDPSLTDQNLLPTQIAAGVQQYFNNKQNAFAYKVDGIRGAAQRVSQAIQNVVVTAPAADAVFSALSFPSTLLRYIPTIPVGNVTLSGPV